MPLISTPIPESLGHRLSEWRRQPWGVALWQALIFVLAVAVAALLVSLGSVGIILGFLIVSFFFRDPIQDFFADVWDRDFWKL